MAKDGSNIVHGQLVVDLRISCTFYYYYFNRGVFFFVGFRSSLLVNNRGPESFWLMRNVYNRDEFNINYEYYDQELRDYNTDASLSIAKGPRSRSAGGQTSVRTSKARADDMVLMKWTLIVFSFSVFACK